MTEKTIESRSRTNVGEGGADYGTGIYPIDSLLGQLKGEIQILRELNKACLEKLQGLHPEWRYRLCLTRDGYQILDQTAGQAVSEKRQQLVYSRVTVAFEKMKMLNDRSEGKQIGREDEKTQRSKRQGVLKR